MGLTLAAFNAHLNVCEYLISTGGVDLMAATNNQGFFALSCYGDYADPPVTLEEQARCCAKLEGWWADGPHPTQVQRRRDERWVRRGLFVTVLAEHAFRPLARHRSCGRGCPTGSNAVQPHAGGVSARWIVPLPSLVPLSCCSCPFKLL